MRIQLDFKTKTVKIEDTVELGEFVKKIRYMLPDWESWTLESFTITANWIDPYIVPYRQHEVDLNPPQYPWEPFYTTGEVIVTNGNTTSFNVEITG